MTPYSPIPRFVCGTDHQSLIQRALRPGTDPDVQRIDLITTTTLRLSLVDSGNDPPEQVAEGDTCVHPLFQLDEEADASISIGGEDMKISPGDFCWIPAGDGWQLSPNQLALVIAVRSNALALPINPTHGDYQFDGYNRETVGPATSRVTPSRWKITQPLELPDSDSERIFISLWNDLAMQYEGGISMLYQGHASVIHPGTGQITLVPDGLSHILAIRID